MPSPVLGDAPAALFAAVVDGDRTELQLEDVVHRGVRGERRVEERQRPRRLDHPAHQVEAIADHRTGDAVTRHRHGGQRHPRIRRRVVRLDGSKRADEFRGGHLAAGDINPAAVRARGPAAASGRHPLLRDDSTCWMRGRTLRPHPCWWPTG